MLPAGEMGRSREPEDGRHRDRDREREQGRSDRHRPPGSDRPRDRERDGSHHSREHDRDRGHRCIPAVHTYQENTHNLFIRVLNASDPIAIMNLLHEEKLSKRPGGGDSFIFFLYQ